VGSRRVETALPEGDLIALADPVRKYLARHTDDPHELEDLTQEALARVWEARARIDRSVAASYAVATARNLVLSERRYDQLHRRHQHRPLEMPAGPFPEEAALEQEEQAAAALRALDEPDQELLRVHYVSSGGAPVRSEDRGTPSPSRVPPASRLDWRGSQRHRVFPSWVSCCPGRVQGVWMSHEHRRRTADCDQPDATDLRCRTSITDVSRTAPALR